MDHNDISKMALGIVQGQWPEGVLSNDQQISIINFLPNVILTTREEDNVISGEQVTNIALWLGGLHRDIQVYAWQLIRRVCGVEVHADDKASVRLFPIEEKIFQGDPYTAASYDDIVKFNWPREWLDGSTFEDRLDVLVDEFCYVEIHEMVTPDMILTGIHQQPIDDIATCYALITGCIEEIGNLTIRRQEKIDRFLNWLSLQSPEMQVFGRKMVENLSV